MITCRDLADPDVPCLGTARRLHSKFREKIHEACRDTYPAEWPPDFPHVRTVGLAPRALRRLESGDKVRISVRMWCALSHLAAAVGYDGDVLEPDVDDMDAPFGVRPGCWGPA